MRKILSLLLTASILLINTACSGGTELDPVYTSDLQGSDNEPDNIDHDNPREDYTKEEAAEIINKMPNLKTTDDFYACVPKSIDHVSTFYEGTHAQISPEKSLEEFYKTFEYIFPEVEADKNSLYYCYYFDDDESDETLHMLYEEENYDIFMNQIEESWKTGEKGCYLFYHDDNNPKPQSVSATWRFPFGNDLSTFNKGAAQRIAENIGDDEPYYAYEHVSVSDFEFVKSCPPDSEETFKLLDKEISIKDAADFVESYIDGIPTSAKQIYKTNVYYVNVYKMNENSYCFYFITSREYDKIHFNSVWDGNNGISGFGDIGYAVMVKSDDVDGVYVIRKTGIILEETAFTEIIPFDDAVKTASEKLTEYVDFQVMRAELLYCSKETVSGYMLGEDKWPIYPVWKFTLSNSNDDLLYTAYVNALTGEFNVYHK